MRWLASRPRWLLACAFVFLLLGVAFAPVLSNWILGGTAGVLVFLLFFATLMAFMGRRENPRPPGSN
jgi:hypothetical protein